MEKPSASDDHGSQTSSNINVIADYAGPDDPVVHIKIGNKVFRVSRSRLVLRSPQFRTMFDIGKIENTPKNMHNLPIGNDKEDEHAADSQGTKTTNTAPAVTTIELHNDPDEFEEFIWYLHADPIASDEFRFSPSSTAKCMRLLGIASVAHMYEALDVAEWAMDFALNVLVHSNRDTLTIDAKLATRLLRTAARWGDTSDTLRCARDIVCLAMRPIMSGPLSTDVVSAIIVASQAGDKYVLGHAYYYALIRGDTAWKYDPRLRAFHRRNILCGSHVFKSETYRRPGPTSAAKPYPMNVLQGDPEKPSQTYGKKLWKVWTPAVDPDIKDCRDKLATLFDSGPFRLDD